MHFHLTLEALEEKAQGLCSRDLPGQGKRVMGLEPTTATLATWRSTTELHPQITGNRGPIFPFSLDYKSEPGNFKAVSAGLTSGRAVFNLPLVQALHTAG